MAGTATLPKNREGSGDRGKTSRKGGPPADYPLEGKRQAGLDIFKDRPTLAISNLLEPSSAGRIVCHHRPDQLPDKPLVRRFRWNATACIRTMVHGGVSFDVLEG
jgi:hypothetical protein